MNGHVDDAGRAILDIGVRNPNKKIESSSRAWVDTGFTGDLILPKYAIQSLGLRPGPILPAILADGTRLVVATHRCEIQWFGKWKRIEVVATDGNMALLGVKLLVGRDLRISYRDQTVSLD